MTEKTDELTMMGLFSAPVYAIEKPEYLEVTRKVAERFISKRKGEIDLNPNYPVYMTENINYEPEMLDFANYVAQVGWNILNNQGYAMDNFTTYFTEMWCQEHYQTSTMEKHIHGNGVQLTGFYFLDVPKDSTKVVFHDPRDSKVIINLPEKDASLITNGSTMVNFTPEDGMLFFSNAWLPHSFNKNQSQEPVRFIHFNIAVARTTATQTTCCPAEVV